MLVLHRPSLPCALGWRAGSGSVLLLFGLRGRGGRAGGADVRFRVDLGLGGRCFGHDVEFT